MNARVLIALLWIGSATPSPAYIFTGGPVHDLELNQKLMIMSMDFANLNNLLSQIGLQDTAIKEQIQRAQRLFGPIMAGTYKMGTPSDISAVIDPILHNLANLTPSTAAEKMAQQFAVRQIQSLAVLKEYEKKLAELNTQDQRPLTLLERQSLQLEMNTLNSSLFLFANQQKAEAAAMEAQAAASLATSKAAREKRERTEASLLSK